MRCRSLLLAALLCLAAPLQASAEHSAVRWTFDFWTLSLSIDEDGKVTKKPLAAMHLYDEVTSDFARGRAISSGTFRFRERLEFRVVRHFVREVDYGLAHGKLLVSSAGSRPPRQILKPVLPLSRLDLSTRMKNATASLKKMTRRDLLEGLRRIKGLSFKLDAKQKVLRRLLTNMRRLRELLAVEKLLLKHGVLRSKDPRLARRWKVDKVSSERISGWKASLEGMIDRALAWRSELTYSLRFNELGSSAADSPLAAFVAGSLDRGVGTISVRMKPKKGLGRLLWFSLPNYSAAEQDFQVVKAPKSWLHHLYVFQSKKALTKGSGGALFVIEVPPDKAGELQLLWRRNDGQGKSLELVRPADGSFPF